MPRAGCAMEVLFGRRFTRPAPAVLLVAVGWPGAGGLEGLALNPLGSSDGSKPPNAMGGPTFNRAVEGCLSNGEYSPGTDPA
jgi:hypothetical protein